MNNRLAIMLPKLTHLSLLLLKSNFNILDFQIIAVSIRLKKKTLVLDSTLDVTTFLLNIFRLWNPISIQFPINAYISVVIEETHRRKWLQTPQSRNRRIPGRTKRPNFVGTINFTFPYGSRRPVNGICFPPFPRPGNTMRLLALLFGVLVNLLTPVARRTVHSIIVQGRREVRTSEWEG